MPRRKNSAGGDLSRSPTANNIPTGDPVLDEFLDYTRARGIWISPLVRPHRFPGRGLGIIATGTIKPGTKIIHVPTTALLLPSDVPESFIPHRKRKRYMDAEGGDGSGMRNHALLAAWLAFGQDGMGGEREKYGRWMATWPDFADISAGMPICWPEVVTGLKLDRSVGRAMEKKSRSRPRRKYMGASRDVAGGTNGQFDESSLLTPDAKICLARQRAKFDRDLQAVKETLPEFKDVLNDRGSSEYELWMHAWLLVNTRCFYFVPPGESAPEDGDGDEAMAMCPAIDIFNHSDVQGCTVSIEPNGFTVRVCEDKPGGYKKDEEMFVNYGGHGEDMLWVEYGFCLGLNRWDSVSLSDDIVLEGLDERRNNLLREKNYFGGYTLRQDGVCWRTEVAAWAYVLNTKSWTAFIEGRMDPDHKAESADESAVEDGIEVVVSRVPPRTKAMRRVCGWIIQMQTRAEETMETLLRMRDLHVKELFVAGMGSRNKRVARQRYEMTIKRWKDLWELCQAVLIQLESENKGSFVTGEKGRTQTELGRNPDDVLEHAGG